MEEFKLEKQPQMESPLLKTVRSLLITMVIITLFVFVMIYFIDYMIGNSYDVIKQANIGPIFDLMAAGSTVILMGLGGIVALLAGAFYALSRKEKAKLKLQMA